MMAKTVAVICFACGHEFRRHRTEMRENYEDRAPCPKCRRKTVVYRTLKGR
jgi:DNA-directed RNA polymerase subunit M/transcription elongation factor TFIIS